jgi:phosphoglycerate kinase
LLHPAAHTTAPCCAHVYRPFGVIIGGAKVKDKLPVLASLVEKADMILIGGRMAFTFLAAEGVAVGRTQIEEQWLEVGATAGVLPALNVGRVSCAHVPVMLLHHSSLAHLQHCSTNSSTAPLIALLHSQACRDMRARATERGVQLLLPSDAVVARSLDDDHGCCIVPLTRGCCSSESPCVPDGCFGLDIGPKTATSFAHAISGCKTLFWNGPMGRFEVPGFAAGTAAIAHALGTATTAGATTILGGALLRGPCCGATALTIICPARLFSCTRCKAFFPVCAAS